MPINNLPTALQSTIQSGFLEQQFGLPLRAKLGFRDIADREPFTANLGETITKTRTGLLPAITTAMSPAANSDITSGLTPQNYSIEQYVLSIAQYAANMQLNIVTQRVAISDFFLRNAYALGEQAFRSVDTLAQQALFNTYLGGNTRVRTTLSSTGPTINVDDIRGFQTTLNSAGQVVAVSGSNPVNVTVGADVYSLTGFAADGSNVSTAPGGVSGTLTFSTSVTVADGTALQPVVSAVAPYVLRPSTTTGNIMAATSAGISAANDINFGKLNMQMILQAKATMSANGVPVSESSGMYNLYIDPIQATGLYSDPAFQQFFRGQVTTEEYRKGIIAEMLGVRLQETNLNPVQTLTGVGTVRRAILCGQGALVEGEFTENAYREALDSADQDEAIAIVDGIAHVICLHQRCQRCRYLCRSQCNESGRYYRLGRYYQPLITQHRSLLGPPRAGFFYWRKHFMDRIETYVGQSILEWAFSKPDQNKMVALGKLIVATFGTSPVVNGLACTQQTVATMFVNIAAGEIYQAAQLEATACGTLPPDTTHTIMKQGISLDTVVVPNSATGVTAFAAPSTSGQSINYLIQAQYADSDVSIDPTTGTTPVVLPFYNSATPSSPYQDPSGSGATSNTFRKGIVSLQVKAGTAGATGAQVTPTPDSGYAGLWVVTVAFGQTTVVSANISAYAGSPALPSSLLAAVQNNALATATAGGTANAITANFPFSPAALIAGQEFTIVAASANTGAMSLVLTLGGTAQTSMPIVKGANQPLIAGDYPAGYPGKLNYSATYGAAVMENPATGIISVAPQLMPLTAAVASSLITASLAAVPLEYRNATLTTGSGITLSQAALTIAMPSIAVSLGATSGVATQIAVLSAYNAGSPVLCLENMSGGLDLSETGLISPTTISAGATSASVIYSASTVAANSPYRVVGYLNATWTSGTGWTLSQVQPYGGQAMAAMQSAGFGQTWQAVTRVSGTTYYNPTGKPIQFAYGSVTGVPTIVINGVTVTPSGTSSAGQVMPWTVPVGGSYSFTASGGINVAFELR